MSFSIRIEPSTKFERDLFQAIEDLGFATAKNGTEHTHPDYVKLLRQSQDQTSLAIRFQPDGVACIGHVPRSFYVEAKAAKTIERLAWEQYWKLYEAGNILVVVFSKFGWMWNFIEEIDLISAEETINRFPEHMRFPIVDGWITPRASTRWLNEVRIDNPQASGTPYREVNDQTLRGWAEFKPAIINRLQVLETDLIQELTP